MAAAPAAADAKPGRGGPSLVIQVGLLVALTGAAAGMGWVSGGFLQGGGSGAKEAHAPAADTHGAKKADASDGHGAAAPDAATIVPLPAITANIGSPRDVWVRMEVSLVLDEPQPPELSNAVLQDLLAYMRTVKLHEIEGPSGFRHLRDSIEERAAIRSDGHVRQVLIRTLLFE
ncbi:flagellar basal body-associated FliL family protein [Mesorhizobium marinum]|uniref:Flagellar protein FliL n=1 Tax=Mesorhizobium marinum TaxID=3228790 RepID=A0ABV3QU37_9HYPH